MIADDLADIWVDVKPRLLARCADVHRVAAAIDADGDAVAEARSQSHKLAGTVGMFGLSQASALARRIDALVVDDALLDDRRHEVATLALELAAAMEQER